MTPDTPLQSLAGMVTEQDALGSQNLPRDPHVRLNVTVRRRSLQRRVPGTVQFRRVSKVIAASLPPGARVDTFGGSTPLPIGSYCCRRSPPQKSRVLPHPRLDRFSKGGLHCRCRSQLAVRGRLHTSTSGAWPQAVSTYPLFHYDVPIGLKRAARADTKLACRQPLLVPILAYSHEMDVKTRASPLSIEFHLFTIYICTRLIYIYITTSSSHITIHSLANYPPPHWSEARTRRNFYSGCARHRPAVQESSHCGCS